MDSSSSVDSNLRFDIYAVLVALGVAAFLAICFWRLYKLTVSARPEDMMMMPTATASDAAGLKPGALRQQDVAALPVFVVRGADGCAATSVECAVCLAEIGDGETGRLLPGCGHRFHVACIDRWFTANSTCPLCRAAAVGEQAAVETCKAAASAREQVAVVVVQS